MEIIEKTTGWGLYPVIESSRRRARSLQDLVCCAREPGPCLAQGNCRSYGDACLSDRVVSTLSLNRLLSFDHCSGLLRAEAGVTIEEIIRFALPKGWFPPVSPGTKYPTLGGCLAADVHGKNHHQSGSIARYVEELELVLADGSHVACSRQQSPDLFWATLGGMGLTGFIYAAALRLKSVESAYLCVRSERTIDLGDTCQLLVDTQDDYEHSVAWIDAAATGGMCGRGLVLLGNHAPATVRDSDPLRLHSGRAVRVPRHLPGSRLLLTRHSVRFLNALYYRRQWSQRREAVVHYDPFFYPLDVLSDWNRIYGRRGFLQYQFVVPFDDGPAIMADLLALLWRRGATSTLAVLKTFGEQERGPLSFPMPGFTLALDFPLRRGLASSIREATEIVVGAGGRVYLAKDAILERAHFERMYPRLDEFVRVKKQYDPSCTFRSHQSDRLGLT